MNERFVILAFLLAFSSSCVKKNLTNTVDFIVIEVENIQETSATFSGFVMTNAPTKIDDVGVLHALTQSAGAISLHIPCTSTAFNSNFDCGVHGHGKIIVF